MKKLGDFLRDKTVRTLVYASQSGSVILGPIPGALVNPTGVAVFGSKVYILDSNAVLALDL